MRFYYTEEMKHFRTQHQVIDRLSLVDQGMGIADDIGYHMPMNLVVLCTGKFSGESLQELNRTLMHTVAAKLVQKSHVPFARDYWIPLPSSKVPSVHLDPEPIGFDQLSCWLDSQQGDLTAVIDTAGWKISAVNLTDNRYVVSVLVLHQLIDGHGVFALMKQISRGDNTALAAETTVTSAGDVRDLVKNWKFLLPLTIFQKIGLLWAKGKKWKNHCLKKSAEITIDPQVTVLFNYVDIQHAAEMFGGSVTNLGIALTANIAYAALGKKRNQYIVVPMKGNDQRSNSLRTAHVDLRSLPYPIVSLAAIKPLAKAAYERSGVSFFTLKKSWCAYSNPGKMPDELADIFPDIITGYAKITSWSTNDRILTRYKTISATSTIFNDTFGLTFTAINAIDTSILRKVIDQELARFGLQPLQVI